MKPWMVLWLTVAAAVCAARADELLVSNFFSDSVGRHDLASGAFLGTLQPGVGLDAALCTRVGPDGLLYVASEGNDSILRYQQTGAFVDTFVSSGSGGLDGPTGVTWGPDGNLYVSSFNTDTILKYDGATGASLGTFVPTGISALNGPDNGTIFGPDGNLYVPSYFNNRILRYNGLTGAFMGQFVSNIGRPRVLEFRGGMLYVTSETADAVRRYDGTTGVYVDDFVTSGSGGLDVPVGMVFGPDGYLYVSSSTHDDVLRFDGTSGAFVGTFIPAGLGGIDGPLFLNVVPEPATSTLVLVLAAGCAGRRARRGHCACRRSDRRRTS